MPTLTPCPRDAGIFLVGGDGRTWRSADGGASWRKTAAVGGQPNAFDTGRGDEPLVALHDGTIKRGGVPVPPADIAHDLRLLLDESA